MGISCIFEKTKLAFKGTFVNWTCQSSNRKSFEITCAVPLDRPRWFPK